MIIADHEITGHDGHHVDIHKSKTSGINHIVCHTCRESLVKLVDCEVYSRCCGYLRPISGYNQGKASEFKARKTYKIEPENS